MNNIFSSVIRFGLLSTLLLFCVVLKAVDPEKRERELLKKLQSDNLEEGEKIRVWYNLATVYIGYKTPDARLYAKKLDESNDELGSQYGRMIMAGITLNAAHYDSTEMFLNDALKEFQYRFSSDIKMGSEIYNRFGHLQTARSIPESAIKNYLEALKLSEKIPDYSQMCAVCTNISYLYGQVGADSKIQLDYAYKALDYAEKSKDPWALEQAYSTLGNTLQEDGEIEEALKYQLKGLELSRSMKSEQKECFAALNIGCTYLSLERWTDAGKYFDMALDLARKNDLRRPEAYILSCLSDVYRGLKQYDTSEKYVTEALEKKDALSDSEQLDIYLSAINLSVLRGDFETFSKQFTSYQDQLNKVHDLAIHEKMAELETQFETGKKDQQIADMARNQRMMLITGIVGLLAVASILLALFFRYRLANSHKTLAEQRVSQLEQEKKLIATQAVLDGETSERSRLARDLHDGLGSMLSVIKLNLNDIKEGVTLEAEDVGHFNNALSMLDDSIKELRRVAHNMMPDSLMRYGLKVSLTDFCHSISNVQFHFFGTDKRLDSKLEIMVYRTVHELVNNAIKHAEAEMINVQIIQEDERLSVIVQDNGIGFNTSAVMGGMGLSNIEKRVKVFNGGMNIFSQPGKGTEINIEFKLL
ncbi:MAG TPA: histidine kinase [Bacteroidales bacterium]|nr:histidine kinase [Bacteroidales bacterium]